MKRRPRYIDTRWQTPCNICGGVDLMPDGRNGHNSVCPFGPDPVTAIRHQDLLRARRLDEESDR